MESQSQSQNRTMFNLDNDNWKTGKYQLFLGEQLALYDSVNTPHPELFNHFKLLKSMDWAEDEVNLEQSRLDLVNCTQSNYDIMIKTLAFQWELDSVASRSIAPLFAPFVTNSELWVMISKQSENENLHALTYSEIIRQCLPDPNDVFAEVMHNQEVVNRSKSVLKAFDELNYYSGLYQSGGIDLICKVEVTLSKKEARNKLMRVIIKAYVALYALEKIEFLSSFACTFALAEQNIFMGIAKLVQKIAQDEQVHVMMDESVLSILMADSEWNAIIEEKYFKFELEWLITEVVNQELAWNEYLFSEKRSIVGLNKQLLNEWVYFNAKPVYDFFGIEFKISVDKNPLPWMMNWLDLNKTQNANQEADNTNYRLNTVVDDADETIFEI